MISVWMTTMPKRRGRLSVRMKPVTCRLTTHFIATLKPKLRH